FGLLSLSISYRANATYVETVGTTTGALSSRALAPSAALPAEALLPRLDALRAVVDAANEHDGDVPWRMRMGLYRGKSLGDSAQEAYLRELNNVLLPVMASRFADQVRSSVATPDRLYEYLKGYLMLG